jgi:hypothetical protein
MGQERELLLRWRMIGVAVRSVRLLLLSSHPLDAMALSDLSDNAEGDALAADPATNRLEELNMEPRSRILRCVLSSPCGR